MRLLLGYFRLVGLRQKLREIRPDVVQSFPAIGWIAIEGASLRRQQGLRAPMTIASPTDGDVFLAYLEQVLCPQLQSGQVVILDNLAAHKVAGVRSLIESCGAQLLYLPPYSPDFNPSSKRGPISKNCCGRLRPA